MDGVFGRDRFMPALFFEYMQAVRFRTVSSSLVASVFNLATIEHFRRDVGVDRSGQEKIPHLT
jgi:hypothetical protein